MLSTPIPILTAATVTVITSKGMPVNPIVPITAPAAKKLGSMPIRAIFIDLNKNRNITNIDKNTMPILPIKDPNKLCSKLL